MVNYLSRKIKTRAPSKPFGLIVITPPVRILPARAMHLAKHNGFYRLLAVTGSQRTTPPPTTTTTTTAVVQTNPITNVDKPIFIAFPFEYQHYAHTYLYYTIMSYFELGFREAKLKS